MTATAVRPETEIHCWRCDKKLANYVLPPYDFDCPRCHAKVKAELQRNQPKA